MILCLTLLLGIISFAKGSTTNKRDICTTVYQNFYECTRKAYQDYETIILNGDDGRKDWDPRKTCNYMNTAIDGCINLLLNGDCFTLEEVNAMKDSSIIDVLRDMKTSVKGWDSAKCPTTIAYFERTEQKIPDNVPVDELSPAQYSEAQCVKEGGGGGHPADEGDTIVEDCVRKTCKSGEWRPSMEKMVCCHNNEAFQPQSVISTTSSPDGCFTTSITCVLQGDSAKTIIKTKQTCGKSSTKEEVDNLKDLIKKYLMVVDSCKQI